MGIKVIKVKEENGEKKVSLGKEGGKEILDVEESVEKKGREERKVLEVKKENRFHLVNLKLLQQL